MSVKRIAHRGYSSIAPENSHVAFAVAVEGDFFGVECDVWKCLDGTYVISHDGNLMRMCGVDQMIPELTYPQLQKYPFTGGRRRKAYPPQYICSLPHYLLLLARVENRCPVIELKMNYTAVELREIVSLVSDFGLYDRTYFISLYPAVLLRLKDELGFPVQRLQYVYGATPETKFRPVGVELEQWLIGSRINLDTRHNLLSQGNVMRLHAGGIQVNVWTVNNPSDFRRLTEDFSVDMVTTEYYFDERK